MMNSMRKTPTGSTRYARVLAAAFGLLMLGVSFAGWAALRAQLDRTTAQEGETLTLTIESDAMQSGTGPDLSPLRKDFEVLGSSTSTETSIVNGTRSNRTRWLVRLQPRRTGALDIPAITVGNEHTAPLVLNVAAPSPQAANQSLKHLFLEVEAAAGKSIYVQQQIPYSVRLYYDDTVKSGDLAPPSLADAVVEQLGEEKHYTATHGGREYNVVERHYAIEPEKSGTLRIPPASFRGRAVLAQNRSNNVDQGDDLMANMLRNTPFANDPFFKNSFGGSMFLGDATQPIAASSQEITLNVQPRPAGAPRNWLPAEQITLHDSWVENPPRFKAGEPVTRTITIDAKGLAASQIPPLSIAQPVNARLYPEAPDNQSRTDGKTIYGISKQSVTYIPTAQGTLNVPPIELAWWNTRSNTQSREVLPAWEFKVEPGTAGEQAQASPPASSGATSQTTSAATPSVARHPLPGTSILERLKHHTTSLATGAALLLALVITLVIVLRRSRLQTLKSPDESGRADPVPRRSAALQALQQACAGNDGHAAKNALLDLARAEWPGDPPRSLGALSARLESGREEINVLDRSLYGAGESRWAGGALWSVIRRGLKPKRSEALHKEDGLKALYR